MEEVTQNDQHGNGAVLNDDATTVLTELVRGLQPGESREWSPVTICRGDAHTLCILVPDFEASVEIKGDHYVALPKRNDEGGEIRSAQKSRWMVETLMKLVKPRLPLRQGVTFGELFRELGIGVQSEGMQT